MHFNSKYNGSSLAPDHFLKAYLINICIARQKNAFSQDFFTLHKGDHFSFLIYNIKTQKVHTVCTVKDPKESNLIFNRSISN